MSPRAVLDMRDARPIWAMPDWVPEAIRAALPDDWELVVIGEETDGSGDGAARVSPGVLAAVAGAELYFGYGIPAELLQAGRELRWVHSGSAGVGSSLHDTMRRSEVIFTNSAGIHGPPIAESVLAMMLHFFRGIDFAVESQRRGLWSTGPFYEAVARPRELSQATVGIVGFGGIGRDVARRVGALGARVRALKRTPPRAGDADLVPVAGGGSLGDRIQLFHGAGALVDVLAESDVVVVCAPDTPETRGFIDDDAFAAMKPGALFINVARGRLVDEDALLRAVRSGRMRGAGLDVFAREPLPEGHPLWSEPSVLITPHVSAVTPGYWRRETELIVGNLERYLSQAPRDTWVNVVDKAAGY